MGAKESHPRSHEEQKILLHGLSKVFGAFTRVIKREISGNKDALRQLLSLSYKKNHNEFTDAMFPYIYLLIEEMKNLENLEITTEMKNQCVIKIMFDYPTVEDDRKADTLLRYHTEKSEPELQDEEQNALRSIDTGLKSLKIENEKHSVEDKCGNHIRAKHSNSAGDHLDEIIYVELLMEPFRKQLEEVTATQKRPYNKISEDIDRLRNLMNEILNLLRMAQVLLEAGQFRTNHSIDLSYLFSTAEALIEKYDLVIEEMIKEVKDVTFSNQLARKYGLEIDDIFSTVDWKYPVKLILETILTEDIPVLQNHIGKLERRNTVAERKYVENDPSIANELRRKLEKLTFDCNNSLNCIEKQERKRLITSFELKVSYFEHLRLDQLKKDDLSNLEAAIRSQLELVDSKPLLAKIKKLRDAKKEKTLTEGSNIRKSREIEAFEYGGSQRDLVIPNEESFGADFLQKNANSDSPSSPHLNGSESSENERREIEQQDTRLEPFGLALPQISCRSADSDIESQTVECNFSLDTDLVKFDEEEYYIEPELENVTVGIDEMSKILDNEYDAQLPFTEKIEPDAEPECSDTQYHSPSAHELSQVTIIGDRSEVEIEEKFQRMLAEQNRIYGERLKNVRRRRAEKNEEARQELNRIRHEQAELRRRVYRH